MFTQPNPSVFGTNKPLGGFTNPKPEAAVSPNDAAGLSEQDKTKPVDPKSTSNAGVLKSSPR
jgi:hypothetical protein